MGKIEDVLNRMADLADSARAKVGELQRNSLAAKHYKADVVIAANRAIQPFIGRIRAMLLQNFEASGIESHTGNLKKGVRTAHVWCSVDRSGKITLLYGLGKNLKDDVYRYGQALASGSVRAPMKTMDVIDLPQRRVTGRSRRSVLGAKAKKSIKAAILGTAPLSKRTKNYLAKSANNAVGGLMRDKGSVSVTGPTVDNGKSVKIGQVTVIKPKMYFKLTDAQVATFQDEFMQLLQQYMTTEEQA